MGSWEPWPLGWGGFFKFPGASGFPKAFVGGPRGASEVVWVPRTFLVSRRLSSRASRGLLELLVALAQGKGRLVVSRRTCTKNAFKRAPGCESGCQQEKIC